MCEGRRGVHGGGARPQRVALDLAAVSRLDEVRIADCTLSRENLRPVVGEHALGMSY